MSEHLTQTQIDNYGGKKLPAAELLSVADHLALCEECRRRVEMAMNADAAFFTLRAETLDSAEDARASSANRGHLTFEQTAGYLEGTLVGEELRVVRDHVSWCELCAASVTDLREFKNQVEPELNREYQPVPARGVDEKRRRLYQKAAQFFPHRSTSFVFVSALAALLLMVVGWLAWEAIQRKQTKPIEIVNLPSPTVSPTNAPSTIPPIPPVASPAVHSTMIIARLKDGGGEVTMDQESGLSGVDNLPSHIQQLVKGALSNRRLEKSPLLSGLTRPVSSLMGGAGAQDNQFSIVEPIGKVTLSDRPTFRWSGLQGATGFIVEVYDEKFSLATSSPQISGTTWTPLQPLSRGGVYSWQVKAIKDGKEIISPQPPAPQAKFRVLDQAKTAELEQAQRAYASSHLTLGLLYSQAGMLDEAERELRALQKANPNSEIVRQFLADLRTMRR